MLVLSRKAREEIVVGNNVVISVQAISGNRVKLAITAPRDVTVLRGELLRTRQAPVESLTEWVDLAEASVGELEPAMA